MANLKEKDPLSVKIMKDDINLVKKILKLSKDDKQLLLQTAETLQLMQKIENIDFIRDHSK